MLKKLSLKTTGGLLAFISSLSIYLLSIEPTNSFWDCSEFITCAYNLEVGHAPGAPVFMLLGRLFSLLAPGPEYVALLVNALSATCSALTVWLLYLCIFHFIGYLRTNKKQLPELMLSIAAFIGAMTYAVSDSFWFSAVEAEVYATSSLFTALVFWLAIKYVEAPKGIEGARWIILIFFVLGLSVGIHLLNLLCLPALALMVYFKHYEPSKKGILLTLVLSGILLVFFVYGIIPGTAKLAAYSDLLFVNQFSLPRYSGALFFVALLAIGLILAYRYLKNHRLNWPRIAVLAVSYWLIGYSSFAILVIRSAQNPFVDINNVENIFGLVDYLNREQYPTRPLIYGNNYNSPIVDTEKRYTYKFHDGQYHKDELNPKYHYDNNTQTLFPRMASTDERHQQAYKQWVNIKGKPVKITDYQGQEKTIKVPTLGENIRFFVRYQMGYMYWRYFMWNFVGRQNDIQGFGDLQSGNWISGIPLVDNLRLGNQDELPEYYKNHAAQNRYYFLPFILGIIGLVFQFRKHQQGFWINMALFFFTGLAIVLYLNEVPVTPRERDYVHVGSFFVFALWIGLGAFALMQYLWQKPKAKLLAGLSVIGLFALVPGNMLAENWNDHNRSQRQVANALGKNMLRSCAPNAILCTTADNDTYPLWYLQDVEQFRPDIRNILLTFLPVDWYADQLHLQNGEKGSIPIDFQGEELLMHKNQYFPIVERIDSFMDVEQVLGFIKNTDRKTKVQLGNGELVNYLPGKKLSLKVNKENLLKSCSYIKDASLLPDEIRFSTSKRYLGRDDLLILNFLARNNWERPVYFVYPELLNELGLGEYLHREGMVYRFLPYKRGSQPTYEHPQALHQYKLLMKDYTWGNIENPEVFLDHTHIQMAGSFRLRQMFTQVASQLALFNEKEKAIEVLDKAQELFPPERIPYSWFMPEMVQAYLLAGEKDKALALSKNIKEKMEELVVAAQKQKDNNQSRSTQEALYVLQKLQQLGIG